LISKSKDPEDGNVVKARADLQWLPSENIFYLKLNIRGKINVTTIVHNA
jgi:hypothetical protein